MDPSEEEQLQCALALSRSLAERDGTSGGGEDVSEVEAEGGDGEHEALDVTPVRVGEFPGSGEIDEWTMAMMDAEWGDGEGAGADGEHGVDGDQADSPRLHSSATGAHFTELDESEEQRTGLMGFASASLSAISKLASGYDAVEYRAGRARLNRRIKQLGLIQGSVPSDGNCQFSSISDLLYGTWRKHRQVRAMVIEHLHTYRRRYETFVPYNFDRFLAHMSRSKVWGNHITLQAAADYLGVEIRLLTSRKKPAIMSISPALEKKSSRVLQMSYLGDIHYSPLYTREEFEERIRNAPREERTCRVQ